MKKTLKVLVSTVATIAILAASTISALAATPGTITIENATVNKEYAAYKIFDAEKNGNSISYTIVGEASSEANQALFASGSPFALDSLTGEVSVIKDQEGRIPSFLSGVVKAHEGAFEGTDPVKADSSTVVIDVPSTGYYFVTSTLGTAVSITTAATTATVIDKNDMPSWNPQPVDPNHPDDNPVVTPPLDLPTPPEGTTDDGKFVSDTGENGSYAKVSTSGVNQKEFFMISAHCPALAGSNKVVSYIFTDTLADGFTYQKDAKLYTNVDGVLTPVTAGTFTATENGQKITFTYVVPSSYAGAELVIKYTAITDENAVYDNVNKVDMDWTYIPYGGSSSDYDDNPDTDKPSIPSTQDPNYPGNTDNPDNPNPTQPPKPGSPDYDPAFPPTPNTSKTDTYVYQFNVIKKDSNTKEVISGAQFKLYSDAACETEIPVVAVTGEQYQYRVAETGATINPEKDIITAGNVKIFGLDKGTYYLVETKAPTNYNLLKTAKDFAITTEKGEDAVEVEVLNSQGSMLPSTGGMGTTIFIVAGSVLMAGAFIGIITKKRMSLKDEEQ